MTEQKKYFQLLLDVALPFAKRMLEGESEFIPFGAILKDDSNIALVAGDVGSERPSSQRVVDFLMASFKEQKQQGNLAAAVICFMGIVSQQDVAVFRMSHATGDKLDVFLPYEITQEKKLILGKIFASKGVANFLND